jgi:hypothetical protein
MSSPTDELQPGEIVVLTVVRIENYGAYFSTPAGLESVLVLIPEISWNPESHPSAMLSIGETRRVSILRKVSESEYIGSLRVLEPGNPYVPLMQLKGGEELRAEVEIQIKDQVLLRLVEYPEVTAIAPCGEADRLEAGSEMLVVFRRVNQTPWAVEVDLKRLG